MKSRAVLSVLAVIGIIALAVPLAQAGGGHGIAAFDSFFMCESITSGAANQGRTVSINELAGGPPIYPKVKVGNAVLVCRPVDVKAVDKQGTDLGFLSGNTSSDNLKCYNTTAPATSGPLSQILTDDLVPQGEAVVVASTPRLLCGPVLRGAD